MSNVDFASFQFSDTNLLFIYCALQQQKNSMVEITVFPLLAIWFLLFFVLAIGAWRSEADAETQRRLVLAAGFLFCYTLCVHLCSALFCCCGVQCAKRRRRRRGSRSRPQQAEEEADEDDDAPPRLPAAVAAAVRHHVLMRMVRTTNTTLLRVLHALFVLSVHLFAVATTVAWCFQAAVQVQYALYVAAGVVIVGMYGLQLYLIWRKACCQGGGGNDDGDDDDNRLGGAVSRRREMEAKGREGKGRRPTDRTKSEKAILRSPGSFDRWPIRPAMNERRGSSRE